MVGHMTGPSVRTLILGRRLAVGTLAGIITPVRLALTFARVDARKVTRVSLLMEFLSAGFIRLDIEPSHVRMVQLVAAGCVSSLTRRISFGFCRNRVQGETGPDRVRWRLGLL